MSPKMSLKVVCSLLFLFSVAANILIPCSDSDECNSLVPTSFCYKFNTILGYCTCPAKFTFNSDVSKCVPELAMNAICEDSNQCSHMLTGCNADGICECREGFSYFKGQCRKFVNLHEPCQNDIDCQFSYFPGSTECKAGFCECADGFYQRSENICRIKSASGEPCVVNTDCVDENHICTEVGFDFFCLPPTVDESNFMMLNSTRQVVESIMAADETENEDAKSFGETCEKEQEPCEGLKYSVCSRGLCQCQRGYYESNGVCLGEIGMSVDSLSECGGGFGKVLDSLNRCSCGKDYFVALDFRRCTRAVLGINTSCSQPSHCSPYGAAYCPSEFPRLCRCFDYSTYNSETELCELKTGLMKYCEGKNEDEEDDECSNVVANSECTANRCVCKDNYVDIDGACRPGHNAPCNNDTDCAINDSECVIGVNSKLCRCKGLYTATSSGICGKNVYSFDEACDESEQCWAAFGTKSTCVENVCGCHDESLHLRGGKCYDKKHIGEQCMTSSNCHSGNDKEEATECRNGFCQCRVGKFDDETQTCQQNSDKNSTVKTEVSMLLMFFMAVAVSWEFYLYLDMLV